MFQQCKAYLQTYTDAATLSFFRVTFGFMMFFSLIRFAYNGWIETFYITPKFHFTYYGFSWVKPLGVYTYLFFIVCALAALMVAVGYKYKWAISTFFISFTYIELIDKTYYLNHYYFISVISFVLIFLPASCYFSVDANRNPKEFRRKIPKYTIDVLKALLAIVYIYAGLAKLNSDWLLKAMPLKIWLPANADLPLIGSFLSKEWVAYAFSYFGALYDLGIIFLLLFKRTRLLGFVLVVIFHLLTRLLFPIGVFPFIMIVSSLLFFSSSFHHVCLDAINKIFGRFAFRAPSTKATMEEELTKMTKVRPIILGVFLLFQLLIPFRYLMYPNELFWTEEGYRFSWRVMLMEKAGYAQFTVSDTATNTFKIIDNTKYLTRYQEKQMSFQPDFILEYAQFLYSTYKKKGMVDPVVRVESYVSLNGRLSAPYINPNINLAKENESFKVKSWILPFKDTIWGF